MSRDDISGNWLRKSTYRQRSSAHRLATLSLLILLYVPSLARGQGLVYVDAVASPGPFQNLFPPPGIPLPNVLDDTASIAGDNKWGRRPYGAPTGGTPTIYESIEDDSPQLRMRVSGLQSGQQYGVYIVYWSDACCSWAIRAGLQSGVNPLFDRDGSSGATAGTFAGNATWITPPADSDADDDDSPFYDIRVAEPPSSQRTMYIGFLGTATGVNGGFDVFIDDVPSFSVNRRTWLDGVAYTIGLPGDYNHDDFVDAADFTVWRNSLGEEGTGLAADGDFSGGVDQGDYDLWKQQFGQSLVSDGSGSTLASLSTAAIPEPAEAVYVAIALVVLATFANRRVRLFAAQ